MAMLQEAIAQEKDSEEAGYAIVQQPQAGPSGSSKQWAGGRLQLPMSGAHRRDGLSQVSFRGSTD
eukprot:1027661-Lingulodinium_polyedra.AAC.1